MGVETTKKSWPRPIYDKELAALGKEIFYEKDPDKQAELVREWEEMKEAHWKDVRENNPHLWGDNNNE